MNTKSGTHYNRKCWFCITATFGQLPVTESIELPPFVGKTIMKISEKYRLKALACEKLGREVQNSDFKSAWAEIAIEWHALATRRAQDVNQDRELGIS